MQVPIHFTKLFSDYHFHWHALLQGSPETKNIFQISLIFEKKVKYVHKKTIGPKSVRYQYHFEQSILFQEEFLYLFSLHHHLLLNLHDYIQSFYFVQ